MTNKKKTGLIAGGVLLIGGFIWAVLHVLATGGLLLLAVSLGSAGVKAIVPVGGRRRRKA